MRKMNFKALGMAVLLCVMTFILPFSEKTYANDYLSPLQNSVGEQTTPKTSTKISDGDKVKSISFKAVDTGIDFEVKAEGEYHNWEGVSNISQFKDEKGNYCFAYPTTMKEYPDAHFINVLKYKGTSRTKGTTMEQRLPKFGAVTCDSEGNYYVLSGEDNDIAGMPTIVVQKHSKDGRWLTETQEEGASGLLDNDSGYYTKEPFGAGNCDMAINNGILMINYARGMYNGHQSGTAFAVNISTMKKPFLGEYYPASHCFAQRILPYGEKGFMLLSEGDATDVRGFSIGIADPDALDWNDIMERDNLNEYVQEGNIEAHRSYIIPKYNIFNFYMMKDSSKGNENYAHAGDIAIADKTHAALAGTSAKSMTKAAAKQVERLFIQVFDPSMDLNDKNAYYITGKGTTRKGTTSGYENGIASQAVPETDYGIKWLTNGKFYVEHPQMTVDSKGRFIVLYEKYKEKTKTYDGYQGVYCTILDKNGNMLQKAKRVSKTAKLNACETPICIGTSVYWTGNKSGKDDLYVFRLKLK